MEAVATGVQRTLIVWGDTVEPSKQNRKGNYSFQNDIEGDKANDYSKQYFHQFIGFPKDKAD